MIERAEIIRSIDGAVRLLWGDPQAVNRLNLTVEGFWHSFFAAALVAPAYALMLILADVRGTASGLAGWRLMASGTLVYLVGWIIVALVALIFCRAFDLERRFVPLVVALNWSSVVQMAIYLPVLAVATVLPRGLAGLMLLATTGGLLYYQTFVAKSALETSSLTAFGFVLIDLIVNLSAQMMIEGWFQPPAIAG